MGKIMKGVGIATLGAMAALPSGRAFLSDWVSGAQDATHENLPKVVQMSKDVGNNAKAAAPNGLLEGSTAIPMDTVPSTTIAGLGK